MGNPGARDYDVPVFEVDPSRRPVKARRERPAARWPCPYCHDGAKRSLVLSGGHYVWSVHYQTTHGRAAVPCRASGARMCETGVVGDAVYGERPPACPCGGPA